jgi:hypothetical protein
MQDFQDACYSESDTILSKELWSRIQNYVYKFSYSKPKELIENVQTEKEKTLHIQRRGTQKIETDSPYIMPKDYFYKVQIIKR